MQRDFELITGSQLRTVHSSQLVTQHPPKKIKEASDEKSISRRLRGVFSARSCK